MPDGVTSVDIFVPDSLKQALLAQPSGTFLAGPATVSGDVLAPSGAAFTSSVPLFRYTLSHVPFNPESIPGVIIPQDSIKDDGFLQNVPLGFDFNFYGNTYSKINVYSNGLIMFGPPQTDPARAGFFKGDAIPSSANPNNIIAFAWSDWSPQRVAGGIRYETRGTAPNRRFLLQFTNVPEYSSSGTAKGLLMSQIVLNEGSDNITIYTNTLIITNTSQRVTQGIENADGTLAKSDSVQNPVNGIWSARVRNFFSLSNDAIRFAPPQPPVITAPPNISVTTAPPATGGKSLSLSVSPAVGACAAIVDPGVATATDDAPGVTVAGARSDGLALDAAYPKGVTTITWTATDADGMTATASQIVTVSDKENPSITAPGSLSADNDPGLPSAVVAVGTAQAADNCPDVKISSARSDGAAVTAPYMVGLTTVTWTATDASGNTASASQSITVRDVEAPSLSVPAEITVPATSPKGAVVNYQVHATDNVAVTSLTCTNDSGSTFPIGTSSVTCTAADAAGNHASASFAVTVFDAQAQMGNLIQYILGLGMPSGTTNSLVNQVQVAFNFSNSDNHVACVKLGDFIDMVSKKGREIPMGSSAYMTGEATRIMSVLGCTMPKAHPQLVNPDGTSY